MAGIMMNNDGGNICCHARPPDTEFAPQEVYLVFKFGKAGCIIQIDARRQTLAQCKDKAFNL